MPPRIDLALMDKIRGSHNKWEEPKSWMYIDSRGHITTGVGTMLPDAASASKLPFIHKNTGKPASKEEIETAFNKLKAEAPKQASKETNRSANWYKDYSDLVLKHEAIDAARDKHIERDYSNLKKIYPDFDTYPENIKMALFDMVYNLGAGANAKGDKKATGLRQYSRMNEAIKKQDWQAAGLSCRRGGISADRNIETMQRFLSEVRGTPTVAPTLGLPNGPARIMP